MHGRTGHAGAATGQGAPGEAAGLDLQDARLQLRLQQAVLHAVIPAMG